MRLGYFTMPVHPMGRNWAETLKEDREAIILADRLGFYDAFIGEHLTDACETITNSMLFLASLSPKPCGSTRVRHLEPLPAAPGDNRRAAAMLDHLAAGRFIFGMSPGARTSDAEALGYPDRTATRFRGGDRRHPGDLGARSAL